jgi:hypothetical protein
VTLSALNVPKRVRPSAKRKRIHDVIELSPAVLFSDGATGKVAPQRLVMRAWERRERFLPIRSDRADGAQVGDLIRGVAKLGHHIVGRESP